MKLVALTLALLALPALADEKIDAVGCIVSGSRATCIITNLTEKEVSCAMTVTATTVARRKIVNNRTEPILPGRYAKIEAFATNAEDPIGAAKASAVCK